MIRTSRHKISDIANKGKINSLRETLHIYKQTLESYIFMIHKGELPLKKHLSSKNLPDIGISHSRYKQLIYKHASEIIRSQIDKAKGIRFKRYKRVYAYFKSKERQRSFVEKRFKDLILKDIIRDKSFVLPRLNNITISFDERFFDIIYDTSFDGFVKIILPFFNEKGTRGLQIKVPLMHHKHSKGLIERGFVLRKCIQLKQVSGKLYINFIWEKEFEANGKEGVLGIDVGYRRLLATSRGDIKGDDMVGIYNSIITKKYGSKAYGRCLRHRDNLMRRYVNEIDLSDIGVLRVEELNNLIKSRSGFSKEIRKLMSKWTYRPLFGIIERMCEDNGVVMEKVFPMYTSQACSTCGHIDKMSRKGDNFKCVNCGIEFDADINAAVNISNGGVIFPLHERDKC